MSNTIVTISNHIYQCRGMAIIFDEDLAVLYQTETKQINRAVQRNKARFPSDFAFQLTKEEWDSLRCQTGTSKSGSGGLRCWHGWIDFSLFLIPFVFLILEGLYVHLICFFFNLSNRRNFVQTNSAKQLKQKFLHI